MCQVLKPCFGKYLCIFITSLKLSFVFTNEAGEVVSYCVNVDKSFEGKMLMFVSKQHHMVYPFYTSDNYRITVSGNLRYEVKNA